MIYETQLPYNLPSCWFKRKSALIVFARTSAHQINVFTRLNCRQGIDTNIIYITRKFFPLDLTRAFAITPVQHLKKIKTNFSTNGKSQAFLQKLCFSQIIRGRTFNFLKSELFVGSLQNRFVGFIQTTSLYPVKYKIKSSNVCA